MWTRRRWREVRDLAVVPGNGLPEPRSTFGPRSVRPAIRRTQRDADVTLGGGPAAVSVPGAGLPRRATPGRAGSGWSDAPRPRARRHPDGPRPGVRGRDGPTLHAHARDGAPTGHARAWGVGMGRRATPTRATVRSTVIPRRGHLGPGPAPLRWQARDRGPLASLRSPRPDPVRGR
ncbi:hypothetical protein FTX61_18510 [Nitriliruptoraceae bacterium ZYF776]|nr:hypothetical protein [Profundirhabdus halotolerans]